MPFIETNWIFLLIVGLLSGILSGAFGVGAGIIMVPVLVFLGTNQKEAQGIALAVMAPMALVGAWRYHQNPEMNFDLRIALIIALGSLGGAWIGAHFASLLTGGLLRKLFAVLMILVAIQLLRTK